MIYPRLFENPNALFIDGKSHDWVDFKNIPFSYYNDKMYVGNNGESHHELSPPEIKYSPKPTRGPYSGRIFPNLKIISFWHFPEDKTKLLKILKDITEIRKDLDFSDPNWVVEIPTFEFEELKDYKNSLEKHGKKIGNHLKKIKNISL